MCGLVGIAGDTSGAWKDIFADLLLFDSVRGLHSTGAGFVGRTDENFMLAKKPGNPFQLFHSKEFEDAMAVGNQHKVILGHNRHATVGEKTEANAHPFAFEHVLGMHNGTLDKWVIPDLHNHKDYGTDSEAIFATINEHDAEKTIKLLAGAWALVWYDKRTHKLYFIRNDKRPLHYCYSKDRCTLVWASELEMLKFLMDRRHKDIHKNEIYEVTKDTLYSWEIPPTIAKPFDAPLQVPLEGRKYTYIQTPKRPFVAGSMQTHKATTTHTTTNGTTKITSHSNVVPFVQKINTKKFRPPYKDGYGRVLNKKEFYPMVAEGCAFCNINGQKWGEFVHIMGHYHGYHTPFVCEDCYNSEEVYEFASYAI